MRRTLLTAILCCAAAPVLAQDPAGRVYELAKVETVPRPTNLNALRMALDAAYPAELRAAGTEGTVVVSMVVSPAGETRDVAVVRSTDAAFESATVEAVRVLRFTPAEVDGKPVAVRVELPIQFQVAAEEAAARAPSAPRTPDPEVPGVRVHALEEVAVQPRPLNVPELRSHLARLYPAHLRDAGVRGTVQVRFRVDDAGIVRNPRVVSTTDARFDEATLEAVSHLRFTPARVDGRAVHVWVELPIQWHAETPAPREP